MEATLRELQTICGVRRSRRQGIGTLELIIALPVLVIALVGALQFSTTLAVNSTLAAAAQEAAELAAAGYRTDQITAGVDEILAIHGIALGPGARLVLLDGTGSFLSNGDDTLTSPSLASVPRADMMKAVLLVSTDVTPIPNALVNYCVDFSGKQYELSGAAVMQCDMCDN